MMCFCSHGFRYRLAWIAIRIKDMMRAIIVKIPPIQRLRLWKVWSLHIGFSVIVMSSRVVLHFGQPILTAPDPRAQFDQYEVFRGRVAIALLLSAVEEVEECW